MLSYQVTRFGAPLEPVEAPTPEPQGSEVLLRVRRCGVCHSDLHIGDGYYDLGGGKRLNMAERGVNPPLTMGHEILGEVVKGGPDAGEVPVGKVRLIYPWIGCGTCRVCARGLDNHCMKPRSLGVFLPGGYADHVLVPHPRYLIDVDGIDPSLAATYACSGLTTYSAIQKITPVHAEDWVVVIGAGGLGLMALSMLKALDINNAIAVDTDPGKREAALAAGAVHAVDGTAADAAQQIVTLTDGGAYATLDFVGAGTTAQLGTNALRKGGRHVVVGLFGGDLALSMPLLPLRALALIGSYVGSLGELRAVIDLVKSGKVAPIPLKTRPLAEVNAVLDELRAGKVVGRVVLEA